MRRAGALAALRPCSEPAIIKSLLFALDTSSMTSYLADNWYWMVAAAASGGALLWLQLKEGVGAGISPQEAVMLINREKAVVVDVCEASEFAAGHVGGARNIPLGDLEAKLAGAVKNKTVPLILVCASGARAWSSVTVAWWKRRSSTAPAR